MTNQTRKLQQALDTRLKPYQQKLQRFAAFLGDADGVVDVPNRNNYVYVRLWTGETKEAFNQSGVTAANTPVWVGYTELDRTHLRVLGPYDVYAEPIPATGLQNHAPTHGPWGSDPLRIWAEQFMPYLVLPFSDTLSVRIYTAPAGTTDLDLTASVPASGAAYTLIQLESDGVTISVVAGTPVASRQLLTPADIPNADSGALKIAAVALAVGQTEVIRNKYRSDIYDLRFLNGGVLAGGGIPGGADTNIQYNDGGTFGGDANLTWDKVNKRLYLENLMYFSKTGWFANVGGLPGFYVSDNYISLFFDDGGAGVTLGDGASTEGFGLRSAAADYLAWLDTHLLTSADRTYAFPDSDGTFMLGANADIYAPQGWDAAQNWNPATVAITSGTKLTLTVSADENIGYYWHGIRHDLGVTTFGVESADNKAEGIWYCYSVDGETFTLSRTPFYIFDLVSGAIRADVMLWEFYWDNTNDAAMWIQPEFHSSAFFSPCIHGYAHESFGTRYANGLDITYGTTYANADTRVKITSGEIHDESISAYITHSVTPTEIWEQQLGQAGTTDADYAWLPIYYLSGLTPTWRKVAASSYPFLPVSNNYIYYNRDNGGSWDYSTSIGSSNFVVYWIVGTTIQDEPIVVIPGRLNNASLTAAQAEAFPSLAGLFTEYKLLYRIIYQTGGAGNTNNGKCKIASVTDYRRDSLSNNSGASGTISAAMVSFTPTGAVAATNVQAAIEELDTEKVPTTRTITATAPITIAGGASANLSADRTIAINPASTSGPGSAPQATAPAAGLINVLAIGNGETAYSNKALLDSTNPTAEAVGSTPAPGTATIAARRDHRHAMPGVATTSGAGFAPQATAPAANELNVLGIANGETEYSNKDLYNTTNPAMNGTAAPGTAVQASRSDHVHPTDTSLQAVTQQAWQTVTFQNSWVEYDSTTYGATGYYKDTAGMVHLRGLVKSGTVGDVPIFTLPAGYRPAYPMAFALSSNSAFGQGYIKATGEVECLTGSNASVWLSNIHFRAA